MNKFFEIMEFLWGVPLTIFIVLSGLYFSRCIKFLQINGIKKIYNNTIKN